MTGTWLAGVDGCPAGWIAALVVELNQLLEQIGVRGCTFQRGDEHRFSAHPVAEPASEDRGHAAHMRGQCFGIAFKHREPIAGVECDLPLARTRGQVGDPGQ